MGLPGSNGRGPNPEIDSGVKGTPGPHPDKCRHVFRVYRPGITVKCYECGLTLPVNAVPDRKPDGDEQQTAFL